MNSRAIFQFIFTFSNLILLAGIVIAQALPASPSPPPPPNESHVTTGKPGSITGRVLGDDGQPVAGVSVMVSSMSRNRNMQRSAATDDEGNFKVSELPNGAYNLFASVPGFVSSLGDLFSGGSSPRYRLGDNVTITLTKGGVITGKVYDGAGQPLVGASVIAMRVRDSEGRPTNEAFGSRPAVSDDRGIYRIYGLREGSFVVYTNGTGEGFSTFFGAREVPTYYPAATRDTAQEIPVSAGMEVQGIDIRHRGEAGQAISGTVLGAVVEGSIMSQGVIVELLQAGTGSRVGSTNVNIPMGNGFAIYGVPDGDYELRARQLAANINASLETSGLSAATRRVTVRGNDVTGIELKLLPLGSIAGRVVLEKLNKTDCQITRRGDLDEVIVSPRPEDQPAQRSSFTFSLNEALADDKGAFLLLNLEAGRYRLVTQLPSDHWYVKAISQGSNAAPTKTTAARAAATKTSALNLAATGIMLKGGEKLAGVTMTIAEGAARLNGRIEGSKQARLRVHLVPAEAEAASDLLRYSEVVSRDGSFTLSHLAPGKYWLLARTLSDDESDEKPAKPAAWDANERAKLRREAEAANLLVELGQCQRVKDFVLKLGGAMK